MGHHILIVDDSETARAFIAKTVEICGIPSSDIFLAADGQEALKVIEKDSIRIVFSDINMPNMNGMELVRKLAEDERHKHIPVVIVSTERSFTRIAELKKAGVRAYINKPCTPENLRVILDELMASLEP